MCLFVCLSICLPACLPAWLAGCLDTHGYTHGYPTDLHRSTFDALPETCMMKLTASVNELHNEFDHENCINLLQKPFP